MRPEIEEFARLAHIRPLDGEALPWEATMAKEGIELPPDYRAFVDAFGSGDLYHYRLGLNTPWPLRDPSKAEAALRAFLTDATETCDALRGLRTDHPDRYPYAFHPEPCGLLPWGIGIGGELVFWRTSPPQDPTLWPVVVWDKSKWREYPTGMVAFMLLAAGGKDPFLRPLFYDPTAPVWTPRA